MLGTRVGAQRVTRCHRVDNLYASYQYCMASRRIQSSSVAPTGRGAPASSRGWRGVPSLSAGAALAGAPRAGGAGGRSGGPRAGGGAWRRAPAPGPATGAPSSSAARRWRSGAVAYVKRNAAGAVRRSAQPRGETGGGGGGGG